MRTKLDSLLSDEEENTQDAASDTNIDNADCASSDEDVEDLVFRKAILPTRTGDFDKDFPPSPTVSKGGKNKSKKGDKAVNTSPQPTVSVIEKPTGIDNDRETLIEQDTSNTMNSISDKTEEVIQPNSEVLAPAPDFDLLGNIRASGVTSTKPKTTSAVYDKSESSKYTRFQYKVKSLLSIESRI